MLYVVFQNQNSFIPDKSTTDNILILQEAIHSLNHIQCQKNFMILKLVHEKTYECIERSFIIETLKILHISINIYNVIKNCISTISMNIKWNCATTNSFNVSRGLRQGDPILPYLFVLNLECLSHKIQDLI